MGRAQYAAVMSHALARAVSILGHPMLVLPLAALALASGHRDGRDVVWLSVGFASFAMLVMGYSRWQVRRGRWRHVDASEHGERRALNRFLLMALTAAAALAVWRGPVELAWGLALSAALIAVAILSAPWCKLSLHMAFVVFAAVLLARLGAGWALAALGFAVAVAWSRLRLQRHAPRDLLAGLLAGALAGWAFLHFTNGMAG